MNNWLIISLVIKRTIIDVLLDGTTLTPIQIYSIENSGFYDAPEEIEVMFTTDPNIKAFKTYFSIANLLSAWSLINWSE